MSDSPLNTFSINDLTVLSSRAEDLYKRLGFARPFLSAVKLRDVLLCRGFPPSHVALEIASIASAMRWPFHDIHQVVYDFPLPDFTPLVDTIAGTL